jgi:hypothetical protein
MTGASEIEAKKNVILSCTFRPCSRASSHRVSCWDRGLLVTGDLAHMIGLTLRTKTKAKKKHLISFLILSTMIKLWPCTALFCLFIL